MASPTKYIVRLTEVQRRSLRKMIGPGEARARKLIRARVLLKAMNPQATLVTTQWLEIHFTPKHGSWLNMAEIELSALGKMFADRIADTASLRTYMAIAQRERNESAATVNWQFNTADARIKLKRLYPTIEVQ